MTLWAKTMHVMDFSEQIGERKSHFSPKNPHYPIWGRENNVSFGGQYKHKGTIL
jgi:hypothetical protein